MEIERLCPHCLSLSPEVNRGIALYSLDNRTMNKLTSIRIEAPYLILIGDEEDETFAKTGRGIVQWQPGRVAGQFRFAEGGIDLGVPDLSIAEAVEAGVKSLVIGVAPVGGQVPDSWLEVILEAAAAGLDIVAGLHLKLADDPRIFAAAQASGAQLVDVRVPPPDLPVGTGRKRRGKRVLTVAADCAIGKKYSALALDRAMRESGMNSTFRASGQTGIMIAGQGIPIDAVVADFISGAAELLSPENTPDHWDVIEGQGSLFHPGYSGVSLGLLHGSQPDGFVVCHDPLREHVSGWPDYQLPTLAACIETHLQMGRRTNPDIRCVGITVNTSALAEPDRRALLAGLSTEHGLPCVDPLIDGCATIVDYIKKHIPE